MGNKAGSKNSITDNDNSHDYIRGVKQDQLESAIQSGTQDPSSVSLIEQERAYINGWRDARGDNTDSPANPAANDLIGLALSGGGIRSATFSLGIMQALAARNLFKKIDYLSTVSGGGYIGSSVTWLTSKLAQDSVKGDAGQFSPEKGAFPYGSDDPRPGNDKRATPGQQRMLQYLREHGYYLTPGAGINLFSLIAAVLRGTFLNLLVWIPTFILIFLLLFALPGLFNSAENSASTPIISDFLERLTPNLGCPTLTQTERSALPNIPGCNLAGLTQPFSTEGVRKTLEARAPFEQTGARLHSLLLFEWAMLLGFITLASLAFAAVIYSLATRWGRRNDLATKTKWYLRRRHSEKFVAIALPVSIIALLLGSLPLLATYLDSWVASTGVLSVIAGIIITLRDFIQSSGGKKSTRPGALVAVGAGAFLYGVTLCSYLVAEGLFHGDIPSAGYIVALLVVLVIGLGLVVNLNYISIHRYYRDRLMESFMPDIDDALNQRTGSAPGANSAELHEISQLAQPHGPYHIINTNAVLVSSKQPVYKNRGGDNFILSPLYCGSNATGWRRTGHFMDGKMTLATAVAISGAAANPNTGVGGVGLTRNLFLSLTMSLLNLRLGYWAENPKPVAAKFKWRKHSPNHFRPGAYALGNFLGTDDAGYNENRDFIQLSDGGHFENTGLYELIRRRVKVAIVCDGGADSEFSFSDMQTSVRRIEEDFGARVRILGKASPDEIVPAVPDEPAYPPGAGFSERGHMLAQITYADQSIGWLIFLKTTLIKEVSFKVKGYKAQNPSFPDESTADQFFDEVQFEAYRELGFCIADKMLNSQLPNEIGSGSLEQLITHCSTY